MKNELLPHVCFADARRSLHQSVWLLAILGVVLGCHKTPSTTAPERHANQDLQADTVKPPTDEASIRSFCGDCHALPLSSRFAKSRWQEEVEQGFRLYRDSRRTDLVPTDFDSTLAFFRDPAPEQLEIPVPERIHDTRFEKVTLPWPIQGSLSAVSHLLPLATSTKGHTFLLSDFEIGTVAKFELESTGQADSESSALPIKLQAEIVSRLSHPAHVSIADLDGDGVDDYIVADLGSVKPQSELQGSVWWLRRQGDGEFERLPLRLGLSRVADARALDYDGDGDQDVLVGDFGMHFVGGLYLGLNQGCENGIPQLKWSQLDSRPGIISLPVVDFDQDGKTDYLALISQHYETIQWSRNRGHGQFENHVVYTAGDPSFGSSSMDIVDFDLDGDLDVLYTNGDTFDDQLAKPYHGIYWLENSGEFPFTVHTIAAMPGCYRAVAGDLDGDGDLDVAAVSLLSKTEVSKYAPDTFDAVAWFEQLESGQFARHSITVNDCDAATCALVDCDQDGRLDLIVPPCFLNHPIDPGMTVYLNRGDHHASAADDTPGDVR